MGSGLMALTRSSVRPKCSARRPAFVRRKSEYWAESKRIGSRSISNVALISRPRWCPKPGTVLTDLIPRRAGPPTKSFRYIGRGPPPRSRDQAPGCANPVPISPGASAAAAATAVVVKERLRLLVVHRARQEADRVLEGAGRLDRDDLLRREAELELRGRRLGIGVEA